MMQIKADQIVAYVEVDGTEYEAHVHIRDGECILEIDDQPVHWDDDFATEVRWALRNKLA